MQPSRTILAYLVESPKKISVKLFQDRSIGLGVDIISRFFYFYLWKPSCLSEWNDFIYIGREQTRHYSCEA